MRRQQGLSLVELMISITIGIILMTGVVQLFISSKTTFMSQQAVSRIQETGRLAIDFIARDIRMAGYMGCVSDLTEVTNTLNDSGGFEYRMEVGIEGFTDADADDLGFAPAPRDNTDIVVIRSANGSAVNVTQNNNGSQVFGSLGTLQPGGCPGGGESFDGLCQDDILVVSDCNKARIFQATGIDDVAGGAEINIRHASSGDPGNADNNWGGAAAPPDEVFSTDAEIIKLNHIAYYIAEGTSGEPALFQRLNGTSLELLEGVEDMSVLYGRDTDGDFMTDDYVDSDTVTDWSQVNTVRLELLIRSVEDNAVAEPQPYFFPRNSDEESIPTDRRLRQVFSTTIAIRNRVG